ncbi:MAG: hypothetical protein RIM84_13760 [Alphaproteobacteria bacterium]
MIRILVRIWLAAPNIGLAGEKTTDVKQLISVAALAALILVDAGPATAGTGNRPCTDYAKGGACTNGNSNRRRAYLAAGNPFLEVL